MEEILKFIDNEFAEHNRNALLLSEQETDTGNLVQLAKETGYLRGLRSVEIFIRDLLKQAIEETE